MWHPWMIVFTVSVVISILATGWAIWEFRKDDSTDVLAIGTTLLIFVSVIASIGWVFIFAEVLQNGVVK